MIDDEGAEDVGPIVARERARRESMRAGFRGFFVSRDRQLDRGLDRRREHFARHASSATHARPPDSRRHGARMVLGCVGRFSLSIVGEAYVLSMRSGAPGSTGTLIAVPLGERCAFAHGSCVCDGSCVGGGERGVRMRDPDDDAESYLASAGRGAAGREWRTPGDSRRADKRMLSRLRAFTVVW